METYDVCKCKEGYSISHKDFMEPFKMPTIQFQIRTLVDSNSGMCFFRFAQLILEIRIPHSLNSSRLNDEFGREDSKNRFCKVLTAVFSII